MTPRPLRVRPLSWAAAAALVAGLLTGAAPSAAASPAAPIVTAPVAPAVAVPLAPDVAVPAPASLDPGLPSTGGPQRVVVSGEAGLDSAAGVADAVRRAGGRVGRALPLVGGVAAVVAAEQLAALAAAPGVRAVTADRRGAFVDYSWDESTSASVFAKSTQATGAWVRGQYGKGVGVALIDTGVSPMPDLQGRLVHGPDLSGEGTYLDSYGHGTVMAGLIAGNGADSTGRTGGLITGVAPAAHVVSVKVAGRNGVVDVSTVLQAMHWVSAYREQYGIRVLNLSWGVRSTQHHSLDPLNYAVQRLWAEGIVVVVAAGNSGSGAGTITKPADDPVVLSVGAYNDHGNADPADDSVPSWSSRGPTAAGVVKPDVVAPGRSLTSLRAYGSKVETTYPKALVSPSYIKGSGTSQAAAVAAGVVALLLEARPGLDPDGVKTVLRETASPLAGPLVTTQGRGRLQLEAAVAATSTVTVRQPLTATGLGSLDASRGGAYVVADCGGVQLEIRGEMDVRCQPWHAVRWTSTPWSAAAWTGDTWTGSAWNGVMWKGVMWKDATWTGVMWKEGTWAGTAWTGQTGWTGDTSATSPWSGVMWKSTSWTGVMWKESAWTTGEWTTGSYDDAFLSAFWGAGPPRGRRLPGEAYEPLPRSGL